MEEILTIAPFSWTAIATALIVGGLIGTERQLRGKPVGVRTSTLIVLGTYFFISTSLNISTAATDPTRIIGQVITGVGFLGAGVMMAREGVVIGVTSAATIWILASLGVTIALDWKLSAIKAALIVIFILSGMDILENYSSAFSKGVYKRVKNIFDKESPDN